MSEKTSLFSLIFIGLKSVENENPVSGSFSSHSGLESLRHRTLWLPSEPPTLEILWYQNRLEWQNVSKITALMFSLQDKSNIFLFLDILIQTTFSQRLSVCLLLHCCALAWINDRNCEHNKRLSHKLWLIVMAGRLLLMQIIFYTAKSKT